MIESKLISICIPTRDRVSELEENLRTISTISRRAEESGFSIEVCISDNSTSNDVESLVSRWAEFPLFELHYFTHGEDVGAARNFISALRMACGDYVLLLGDDDYLHEDFFDNLSRAFEDKDITLAFFDRVSISLEGEVVSIDQFSSESAVMSGEQDLLKYIDRSHVLGALGAFISSVVYRGEALRKALESIESINYSSPYAHVEVVAWLVLRERFVYVNSALVYATCDNDSFLSKGYLKRIAIDLEFINCWRDQGASAEILDSLQRLLLRERSWLMFVKAKACCGRKAVQDFFSTSDAFSAYHFVQYIPYLACLVALFLFRLKKKIVRLFCAVRPSERILIVQNYPAPYRVALFNKLFKKIDFDVAYLNPSPSERLWDKVKDDIRYPYLQLGVEQNWLLNQALVSTKLIGMLGGYRKLLVFTDPPNFFSCAVVSIAARMKGVTRLSWVSLWDGYQVNTSSWVTTLLARLYVYVGLRAILSGSTKAIGYCRSSDELARSYGVACESSSQYFPLAEVYGDAKSKSGRKEGPVRLLVISYLSPRKQVEQAIRCVNSNDEFELCIAGVGGEEYVQSLMRLGAGNERICFKGYVNPSQKSELFEWADFLLFTTSRDSWGYVVNEAFYNGVPVVGSDKAMAVKDLVSEARNGFVFGSEEQLAETLKVIAREISMQDDFLERMSKYAMGTIVDFNAGVESRFEKLLAD
ncbi:glycosyltransferase [Agaribacterium sp. ZY112]|uniref:glycosyltransferase n=1 Tax=Agaribacterium sp. ZY112 TaxID=3233574 RepID=UPI00352520E5